jgi:hypothetical protein
VTEKNPLQTQPKKNTSELQEKTPGQSLKQARGLGQDAGHSPNEAGTDQRVEDAKKQRDNNDKKRIVRNALSNKEDD